jgi:GAF domain-containing protein
VISARPDLGEALAALGRATTSLAHGGALQPTLDEVTEAIAHGTGAEVAAVWLPESDGSFVARAVAASGALAAEVEGFRAESREAAAQFVRDAVGPG